MVIDTPLATTKNYLQDFRNWTVWSPWLITEPEASVTFKGKRGEEGSSYEWDGSRVGKGTMLLNTIADDRLSFDLKIIKPFKSRAKVAFEFDTQGDATKVTWKMDSKLPFFMGFMKKMLVGMIGMDYDRGLAMLKSQLETGKVGSKLTLVGERELPALHYIGVPAKSKIADMNKVWADGMQTLEQAMTALNLPIGSSFGLYEKMDIATTKTAFTMCIPVDKATIEKLKQKKIKLKKPLLYGAIDSCDTYVVEHVGAYHHIGNAWSMAYAAAKADKVKLQKKPIGLELYLNNPKNTAIDKLKTEVVLFVK